MDLRKTALCIKIAMASNEMSVQDLATKLGVTPVTVSRWRKRGCDSVMTLTQIAKVFDMSFTEFLELA
jgi:transcriptional regulator with XRE-family HTH domain